MEELSKEVYLAYRIGPGDVLKIHVWNRPEISVENLVVGPDGKIAIPRAGVFDVNGKSFEDVNQLLTQRLSRLYENPEVTVIIKEFHNNKAFVLGRVTKPGVVNFPGEGTLLEALALAGGLPFHGKETFLTRCAIIRGKEKIFWIDLRELLDNGNMALNARIKNNDVIFIPEAEDELVFVMGEVPKPGPVPMKRGLNLMDSIMHAGGFTMDSNPEKVFIIRQEGMAGVIKEVNIKDILEKGDFSKNYALQNNDVIYISPRNMKKFNYFMEQLIPALRVLDLATSDLERFGVMQRLREELWGQTGFVSGN